MAEESVIIAVRKYLNELLRAGIPVQFGIMFGSHARKENSRWSDVEQPAKNFAVPEPFLF